MVIGIDCSMEENIASGYLIMACNGPQPKKVDPDYEFFFFENYSPIYDNRKLAPIPKSVNGLRSYGEKENGVELECTRLSLFELLDMYKRHKLEIDNCCGCNHSVDIADWSNCTVYQMLHLAFDVASYTDIFS